MRVVAYRTVALLVVAALGLAGCATREEPTTPTASVPTSLGTEPTEEPTPEATAEVTQTPPPPPAEPPDPFAVPQTPNDIDRAYVKRVLEELNKSLVEATRVVARQRKVTGRVRGILGATHLPRAREGHLRTFREFLSARRPKVRLSTDPRPVDIVSVDNIISASKVCVFALVTQDTSGLVRGDARPFANYYHLRAKRPAAPSAGNATPWMVALDAQPPRGGKKYADPCR